VHGEAAAARDEAHDAVARDRGAALAEADEEVVDAPDAHGAVALPGAFCGVRVSSGSCTAPGATRPSTCCTEVFPYPMEATRSSTEGKPSSADDLAHLVPAQERGGREAELLRLPLEQLAPELEGARALLHLEPLVDLGAGAVGLDDLQPVAARVLGGRGDHLDDVACRRYTAAAPACH